MNFFRLVSLVLCLFMFLGGHAQHISPDSIVMCVGVSKTFVPATSRSLGKTVKWEWNFGDGNRYERNISFLESPSHRFSQAGDYLVQLTMTTDAQERDTVGMHVKVLPLPAAPTRLIGDTVCVGERALLKAHSTDSLSIHWFASRRGAASLHAGEEFTSPPLTNKSIFFVAQRAENGCLSPRIPVKADVFSTANTQIETNPKASLQWPEAQVYLTVNALMPLKEVLWQFGDGDSSVYMSPIHIYEKPGDYEVLASARSELGCTVNLSTTVSISFPPPIFLPAAFSPNEDGINDFFKAEQHQLDSCTVRIYNSLGEAVYIADTPAFSWDGKGLNGTPVDEGVYVFQIRGIDQRKKPFFQEGSITLVR